MSDDLYWDQVALLMHLDGAMNGSTRFREETGKVVTAVGNAMLSTAWKRFGATSLLLDGSGDWLTVPTASGFAFGLLDFTVEAWVKTGSSGRTIVSSNSAAGGWALWVNAQGRLAFDCAASSAIVNVATGSTVVNDNLPHHVAVTRSGAVLTLWVDGVADAVVACAVSIPAPSALYIGALASSTAASAWLGHIDELRITEVVARYNEPFTPAAEAFGGDPTAYDLDYDKVVLHCRFDGENGATNFVDEKGHTVSRIGAPVISTNQTFQRFGGSSAYLGASDAIGFQHDDLKPGAEDFTIEGWHALASPVSATRPFITMPSADGTGVGLRISSSQTSPFAYNGVLIVNGVTVSSTIFLPTTYGAQGVHFAICREGDYLALFSGGIRRYLFNIGSSPIETNGALYLGQDPLTGGSGSIRYYDEIRYTKGLSHYSKDLTTYAVPVKEFPNRVLQRLSGTVRDSAGNPLARTVCSFRRRDKLLVDECVSDPVTGAFSLQAIDTSAHFVIVMDDAKNALIYDHVVPVL